MTVRSIEVPIKNFHRFADGIYRGGSPSPEGLRALRQLGVKTVVSLRWRKAPVAVERTHVEELGMIFHNIPLNYWSLPGQKQIEQFFEIIDDKRNHPVFVHCFHGADRTGLLLAIYRVDRCGWSFDAAYQEMVECGFHRLRTQHFKWALWSLAKKTAENSGAKY